MNEYNHTSNGDDMILAGSKKNLFNYCKKYRPELNYENSSTSLNNLLLHKLRANKIIHKNNNINIHSTNNTQFDLNVNKNNFKNNNNKYKLCPNKLNIINNNCSCCNGIHLNTTNKLQNFTEPPKKNLKYFTNDFFCSKALRNYSKQIYENFIFILMAKLLNNQILIQNPTGIKFNFVKLFKLMLLTIFIELIFKLVITSNKTIYVLGGTQNLYGQIDGNFRLKQNRFYNNLEQIEHKFHINLDDQLHLVHHHHRQRDTTSSKKLIKNDATTEGLVDAVTTTTIDDDGAGTTKLKTSSTTAKPEIVCQPKVLEEIPPDPLYDVADITIEAAKEFAEYIDDNTKTSSNLQSSTTLRDHQNHHQFLSGSSSHLLSSSNSNSNINNNVNSGPNGGQSPPPLDEMRKKANSIANVALEEDENLLAFAIASPSLHVAVVKFRDNVTLPPQEAHNKSSLSNYWRELGLAWNNTDGSRVWGAPFRDCNVLINRWLWPYRISIVEYGYKIVATAFIAADVDLCNDALEEIFGRTHGCDRETTMCFMTDLKPSVTRNGYTCICRESYYLPNSSLQGFPGDMVEGLTTESTISIDTNWSITNFSCIPCPGGCLCDKNGECIINPEDAQPISTEMLFKASIGSILGACMLCCIVFSFIILRQRKSKAIASGMWTVLETILLGILLLYTSVALHFLPASTIRCLLEPWCRELGFITCYGAIILKLYRHLVEFRTRKAHRWVLRDVDLLKYLASMVFAVVCYLAAFTASSIDLIDNSEMFGLQEVLTDTCVPLKWEYVTQISEVLIICFGLHLAFASRNATTQFRERQFLVAALIIEFIVSTSFYVLRIIYLPELSPGAIFLALFIRSQLTNTVTLGLIFVPKLWYQHKQVSTLAYDLTIRLPVDAFKGSHDVGHHLGGGGAGYAGLCLGDPDIGELTISEMSPEDIRAELKRLYTQLEVLKNKTLRQDNPHISKRRGGRKPGHRRFSLQALSAKHRNKHHDIEITEAEPSRTPEDSVCSNEGPTDTYVEISGISHSGISHSMLSHSIVSHSK